MLKGHLLELQRPQVVLQPIVERHAVEAQIGPAAPFTRLAIDVAALNVIKRRGAKRPRRFGNVPSSTIVQTSDATRLPRS